MHSDSRYRPPTLKSFDVGSASGRCLICNEPLPPEARYCSHCGNSTAIKAFTEKRGELKVTTQLIKCPDCGHAVSDDAVWCLNCGKVIGRPALARVAAEKRQLDEELAKQNAEKNAQARAENAVKKRRLEAHLRGYMLLFRGWLIGSLMVWITFLIVMPWRQNGFLGGIVAFVVTFVGGVIWLFTAALILGKARESKERTFVELERQRQAATSQSK